MAIAACCERAPWPLLHAVRGQCSCNPCASVLEGRQTVIGVYVRYISVAELLKDKPSHCNNR